MMQNQRIISRAIIKAEEKERNRLGAELHDNVNQLLVSARLYIALERKKPTSNNSLKLNRERESSAALGCCANRAPTNNAPKSPLRPTNENSS